MRIGGLRPRLKLRIDVHEAKRGNWGGGYLRGWRDGGGGWRDRGVGDGSCEEAKGGLGSRGGDLRREGGGRGGVGGVGGEGEGGGRSSGHCCRWYRVDGGRGGGGTAGRAVGGGSIDARHFALYFDELL